MKPDSVARFDINRVLLAIKPAAEKYPKVEVTYEAIYLALLEGLVPPEPESKRDMIEISRAVAENYLKRNSSNPMAWIGIENEIKKALSEGRNS